jgi:crotonobetainyl-CoA:carnitine CoA-transferase CaiB-like acyl-CoA transferase
MTIADDDEGNLTKSFDGLRVLDFSTTIAGPHCTRMLADTGAEAIKIETAEGETMRTRRPLRNSCSTAFGQLNVGKNSTLSELQSSQFELKATQRPMFGPIATSRMAAVPSRFSTCRSRMSGAKVSAGRRISTLGEHTRAYLKETGFSDDEIAGFAGKSTKAAGG